MTYPNNLAGNRFRLMRGDGATPTEAFKFVCAATTVDIDEKVDFDDNMENDCDAPTELARRISTPTGQTWDISFSGRCDHRRYLLLRADFDGKVNRTWQMLVDLLSADGGGFYQGQGFIDTLKMGKSDNKTVTFSGSIKGQGKLAFTAAV